MSHHLHALSPLLSSPLLCSKPQIQCQKNSSVVKNLENLFNEQSSLPLIKRSSHPDLQRISSQTVKSSNSFYLKFHLFFFIFSFHHFLILNLIIY
jgi:hypothetical protein